MAKKTKRSKVSTRRLKARRDNSAAPFRHALQNLFSKPRLKRSTKRCQAPFSARYSFGPFSKIAEAPHKEIAIQQPPQVQTPAPLKISIEKSELTTLDFARPNDALKSQIEGFLLDHNSEHTQKSYAKDLKRFVKYLLVRIDKHGPEPLTRMTFVSYKDWLLSEKLEHTTIDRHLSSLRGVFRWFAQEGLIQKNPVEHVRFMNPQRVSKTEAFTDEEVRRVLQMPNLHTRSGSQHYAILVLLFYCGLRRSELCSLRMENISIQHGKRVLKIRGKGDKERVIPLVKAVWNGLVHYMVICRRDPGDPNSKVPLFLGQKNQTERSRGQPMDPSTIFYVVRKYAKMAGIQKRVSPHSCRATAISNARDHHVPDRAIQEFAGWASPDMIIRYDKRKTAIEESAAFAIRYGLGTTQKESEPTL